MDFDLNDEQRMFRDVLRDFVDREIRPVAQEWEASGRYPTEIVETMRELGLFGLTVPEEYGGLGADMVSFALTFEEIAKGWMGVAGILGSHSLSCWLIARHGTDDQKSRYLPDLASGVRRTGIALTEPDAGTDLQGIATTAVRDGDHYVLNGRKTWITNARYADPLPVLCKTDPAAAPAHKGMSVILVEAGTPGFTVERDLPKLGYKGTESCEVLLEDVRVPATQLLGGVEGRGMQQVLSGLETGRINVAARALGIAQAAYDEALEYAGQRKAFGKTIGDFQAVQLKIAEMAAQVQAARLLVYWAASRSDGGHRVDMEAGMAKAFASEAAVFCALNSMQVHGGYGYSKEFVVERLYRDAPLMMIGEGTNDIQRVVIARALLSGAATIG
ncbi:alkylation response protein AidB-like acyl-CoA dehydrogenase [Actinoplanes campanulatus]|uniref:Alkylation response protein AidB-like acyl-CoA dehydrogenase n=1 Tax=Actinoplanes campanulatus TaxID=113559 RepID=A0A7W5AFT0_9ACTN|nr:acyl-CoA dehydrogenase family protein [Actinoplanes campanulatus]MBB3095255.1 alkylation response protein AidB-like acyl-CoA dehydrogenase [Actinoplanes campanulatus]GGN24442.1 isovaleryl-CoA dehydrogenase [Actinoplanes campanulatus]GID34860.1 isovaleryl-CoA dehydrogenase [Actinoplanes campanulatus]